MIESRSRKVKNQELGADMFQVSLPSAVLGIFLFEKGEAKKCWLIGLLLNE
jgi:hypothetical protein